MLFDEKSNDVLTSFYAETTGCVVVSVGYRLAPEDPWPKGVEDVEDAAEWMRKNEKGWGELKYIGGEVGGFFLLSCEIPISPGDVRGDRQARAHEMMSPVELF